MIGKADTIIFIARIHSQIVAFIDVERMAREKAVAFRMEAVSSE